MKRPDVTVRVVIGHTLAPEDEWDYHEWYAPPRVKVKANRLGVPNQRMLSADWTKWVCNNSECPAWALVHDDAVIALIEAAEATA